ncbi:ChaB family protein [Candidatus Pacearchaeota archaeon]|jgi:cation transport regulator ChaB|nr:ChaB family protein [Candidatus Pacearchaeota archaeon]
MPYKTIAELPETFNNLPDEAKRQAMAVINDLLDKKEPEESAIKQAWGAIKASWEQDKDGKWVKKAPKMNELPTIDIPDQEILGVGTWPASPAPIKVTEAMLTDLVTAAAELTATSNYEPPIKLGHDDGQKLLQADGFPAAGWVHNIRKVGDKILCDFKQVPAKLGEIINAGGYKKKSPELRQNYVSGGKTYPWVIRAVSILGADIPACKSTSDIQALYAAEADASIIVLYEPSLDRQAQAIRDAYYAAFQRKETAVMPSPSEYVRDIFADNLIVERGGELWQIPYTQDDTGIHFNIDKAIKVEQVYQPKAVEAPATSNATDKATEDPATAVADDKTIKGTEVEMEKQLRTLLGLDDKGDVLAAATALKKKADAELTSLTEKASIQTKLTETETKLSEAVTKEKAATTKLAEMERDGRVSKAMKDGKIVPAQKAWADNYALTDPAGFDAFIVAAPKAIQLGEKGAEGGDPNEIQLSEEEIDIAHKTGVDLAKLKASKAAEAAKSKK